MEVTEIQAKELRYQKHQAKDYKSENAIRWCPGCGDYAIYRVSAVRRACLII